MTFKVRVTETMQGDHHFVDAELGDPSDRPFLFRIDWSASPLDAFNPGSPRFMTFEASGVMDVEGLTAGETPCSGSLTVDYLQSQTITYDLLFEAKGREHRYLGRKVGVDLRRPLELVKTHTTCYGTISREDGRIVSKSVAHFVPEELFPFLTSFRVIAE